MRRFLTFAALIWPLLATAQAPASSRLLLEPGDSIRVILLTGASLQGSLVRQTADSVGIRLGAGRQLADTAVAFAYISAVESRIRHHSAGYARKGMGIGLLAGARAGGVLAIASMSGCQGEMCGLAIIALPITAVGGAFAGLVGGGLHMTEEWQTVWRPDAARP